MQNMHLHEDSNFINKFHVCLYDVLLLIKYRHTHTHTHIYIYIYIYKD